MRSFANRTFHLVWVRCPVPAMSWATSFRPTRDLGDLVPAYMSPRHGCAVAPYPVFFFEAWRSFYEDRSYGASFAVFRLAGFFFAAAGSATSGTTGAVPASSPADAG